MSRHSFTAMAAAIGVIAGSAHAGDAHFKDYRYAGQSQESVTPGPGEYLNPIVSGYAPDPSVTRVRDDYYLVTSSFTNFPGLPVYHSKDLTTWTQIGNAVARAGDFDFAGVKVSGGMMAPDISYHDGLFYIVGTNDRNFVMTAKDPAGPWSPPTFLDFEGIDPSIFWADDGKAYIVNNGPPEGPAKFDGHRVLWLQQFDPVSRKMVGARTALVGGGDNPPHLFWPEGPHLFTKDGWYYLIAAEGGTGPDENHKEAVFRSRDLAGPYEPYSANPILTQADLPADRPHPIEAAGHAKFVTTPGGEWWAVFLAARAYTPTYYNIGRETYLLPVTWTADGWPVILPPKTAIPYVAKRPNLPAQARSSEPMNGNFGFTDSFAETQLPLGWFGIRMPQTAFYHLKSGDLVMPAGNPVGDILLTPAFIGRKQAHAIAQVETTLSYHPDGDGDRAGLVALQSDNAYLFFGLTWRNGQTVVAVMRRETAADPKAGRLVAYRPLGSPPTNVHLKLSVTGGRYTVAYRVGNGRWEPVQSDADATFLSTKKALGFVGTVIGLSNEAGPSSAVH